MSIKTAPSDILCEFVEVVIHNILYAKKLYPEAIFSRRRKYGVAVYQCIQPDVNEYIKEILKAISFHSKKNQLNKIYLCIHNGDFICEKYIFEILDLKTNTESDPFLIDLEQFMRNFILKLHTTLDYLEGLDKNSTFSIRLQVTAYSNLEFNQNPSYENFPWVELYEKDCSDHSVDIVPLNSLQSDVLKLQLYVEKSVKDI
ncbi:mitotic spindle assembly checkpoint protein MAD2B-like [Diorhabda sublineata]|uniref:mitotic spindle assembly checkpoint protein MAD2B-like n=1 Tax=Diorhabda sublineata TaxID=1163346 RepID=UPI0024E110AD|nr:mitotic spindle assembly checkpoint protein MAD2B-like [Diorhabda sublineata]